MTLGSKMDVNNIDFFIGIYRFNDLHMTVIGICNLKMGGGGGEALQTRRKIIQISLLLLSQFLFLITSH